MTNIRIRNSRGQWKDWMNALGTKCTLCGAELWVDPDGKAYCDTPTHPSLAQLKVRGDK